MPGQLPLHEADALALDGVRDDGAGLAWLERQGAERLRELRVVVAVHFADRPPEGAPLRGQGIERQHLRHAAEALDLVVVHNGDELLQPLMWREEDRLPAGALIQLALAH